jgi:acetoacetyl-CoA synthetase
LSLKDKLGDVITELAPLGLAHIVVVGQLRTSRDPDPAEIPDVQKDKVKYHTWPEFKRLGFATPAKRDQFEFWRGPAMAPLWVLFSSGTTGAFYLVNGLSTSTDEKSEALSSILFRQTESDRSPW